MRLNYDGKITLSIGRNRKVKAWNKKVFTWGELVEKLGKTTYTSESVEEYKSLPKWEQDDIKDVGGFVGGLLKNGKRRRDSVISRQLLTLDGDFVQEGFWDVVDLLFDFAACVYSTHKHSGKSPRLRLVIPLSREVSPEEYEAIGRMVAKWIGIDFFDDSTYEPCRLMYWPSTSKDGEFYFKYKDAPWLNVERVLESYDDWRDTSSWPCSSRKVDAIKSMGERQGNPREKHGAIGAFCRVYDIYGAIEEFLKESYVATSFEDRFTYAKGSTSGGLVVYEKGDFAYSHHSTDPASGRLCNAFDLVRIHKFGHLDVNVLEHTKVNRLPSNKEMFKFALTLPKVKKEIGESQINKALEEFGDINNVESEHPKGDFHGERDSKLKGEEDYSKGENKVIGSHEEAMRLEDDSCREDRNLNLEIEHKKGNSKIEREKDSSNAEIEKDNLNSESKKDSSNIEREKNNSSSKSEKKGCEEDKNQWLLKMV